MINQNTYSQKVVNANVRRHYLELAARVEKLKARSTLRIDADLSLPAAALKTGFMGIMRGAYTQSPLSVFLGLAMAAISPDLMQDNRDLYDAYGARSTKLKGIVKELLFKAMGSGAYTKLVRDGDGFLVTVPILHSEWVTVDGLQRNTFKRANSDGRTQELASRKVNVQEMIELAIFDGNAKRMFKDRLVSAEVRTMGSDVVVNCVFRISREEAQHMTNKKWIGIRPVDMYPLISYWVDKYFGFAGKFPIRSFAVSSIARTLPTDPSVLSIKVNDQQLTCAPNGKPLFILKDCDNTGRFEDRMIQAGGGTTSSFQLVEFGVENPDSVKLPANLPVLTDWVNSKFSYSNTYGLLKIQNLENCRVATAVHIKTWLGRPIDDTSFKRILNLVGSGTSGVLFNVKSTDFDDGEIPNEFKRHVSNPLAYIAQAGLRMKQEENRAVEWGDVAFNSSYDFMKPLGRFFKEACRDILNNLESVFQKYSVEHTMSTLPWIILMAVYAPKLGEINAEAATINSAATNQKGSPDYKMDASDMWNGDLGFQPHQRRAAELLSQSPPFAILPIQAGGGKTPVIINDILMNISKGVGAPYLILCPSHLVAQYVKEINFFTSGRLNCIPVVTRVFNLTGVKRFTNIIKNAPRNSVVVVDYGALALKGYSICYGTENVNVFPVAEALKQFSFGYVALDESHYMKNEGAARTRAAMGLIADIPMKRLASGTMLHDSPSDLSAQISMLDPTIFGTREDFNEEFGLDVRGNRVIAWKPGYARAIKERIKERIVEAEAHRKEWSALLPPINEFIEPVVMSQAQQDVYESILESTLDEIKTNESLMKEIERKSKEGDVEGEEEDLASLLQPHLGRLESFVSAPDKDVLGAKLLTGDDRISPKMAPIIAFITEHINEGRPGKILVFTNHVAVGEHIYENLPPRLKEMAIHYLAAEKVEAGTAFEKDDRKRILVGAEHSLNTGLNLQHASMLIRVEGVWNPGTLEQGDSRINRPSLKSEDKRDMIYYRWIVCNKSIDVTKMARLTAKIVDVAKYENANNPKYAQLESLEIIPLTLDNIATDNTWTGTLEAYGRTYRDYRLLVINEYAEYKAAFTAKYGKDFMYYPGDGNVPEDAALAEDIPWIAGLEVVGEQELNLIRIDQFLRLDAEANEDEASDTEDEQDDQDAWRQSIKEKLIGQKVFCEYGEGIIKSLAFGIRRVRAIIDGVEYSRIQFAAAFVHGKTLKKSIRFNQSKLTSMPLVKTADGASPVPKVARPARLTKAQQRMIEKHEERKVQKVKKKKEAGELQLTVHLLNTNGFLGLRVEKDTHTPEMIDAIGAVGFRPDLPTYRARMRTFRMLDQQMTLWDKKGFMISEDLEETHIAFLQMYEMLKSKRVEREKLTWDMVNRGQLRNFYRMELRPDADKKSLKMYPVMENGLAYIYLSIRGQAGSRPAMRYRAPGVIWEKTPESLSWYCIRPTQIKRMLEGLVKEGVKIRNKEQVLQQYKDLRKSKSRTSKFVNNMDVDILRKGV